MSLFDDICDVSSALENTEYVESFDSIVEYLNRVEQQVDVLQEENAALKKTLEIYLCHSGKISNNV
jgi:DNA-binding PucR family transcriptional regulator